MFSAVKSTMKGRVTWDLTTPFHQEITLTHTSIREDAYSLESLIRKALG